MVNNDLVDEMVEPAQDHNAEQEQVSDGSDNDDKPLLTTTCGEVDSSLSNGDVVVKQEDDRVSSTSLYCSLPLSRDVQSIIDTFPKSSDPERKKTRKLPCLYCERTFVADGLRQKHVERCHSVKQARRSSSRFQQGSTTTTGAVPTTLQCQFCDAFQLAAGDDDLGDLFHHLVGVHSDRYFACVACRERFVLKTHLDEHKEEEHGIKREQVDVIVMNFEETNAKCKGVHNKSKTKDFKVDALSDAYITKALKDEKVIMEHKELRSKKTPTKSTKLGTKRSARLQNKETPPTNKGSSACSTTSSSSSSSSKKKNKAKEILPDPSEREIQNVAIHENPYPTFDAFYRVKKITDHSIDNLRITSLTFSDVFDQAFYTRIKCNIADNLQNHIDGKLFKNEESESRISNFEKSQAEVKPAENNYGCEISLHAATPVASFLAPQLGDDPEAQIEYGSKASKKKTKPDEVHYKYFTRRKYQASIREIKENRDLSKLDMWTQYVVKNRQQTIANTTRSEKERQDYKKGEEYRAKLQNDELNRILDRRGPFEDLKLEANKQAVLDGNASREARVEASYFLEDVLQRVFDLTHPEVSVTGAKTELTDAEIPSYLNLRRASLVGDSYVDRSDKITLICSSEETENFEAPQVSPRDKHALVELSGEWTRSRLYICAACGTRLANMRALIDHKNIVHQNVWCQHYEFVGNQGAYYKHLSIPGLGKMNLIESSPAVKSWMRSSARQCTKCKKLCNTLGELHRHILECGEDWSWMLIRKKCKYRPYGAKTRRKRRGLLKRHDTSKKENKEKKTYKRTDRPREKPSDAETIQRMLANLPAKRATRTEMSLKDGFPKATKKASVKKVEKQNQPISRVENSLGSPLVKRKVMVSKKCSPINNRVRKSVRNLNKVISSALIDNNIMVRRKYKSLQAKQATRAGAVEMPETPVDLTEEQRAEEVKKKISLFKKVQKFRQSVIKKRTTKASSSSAESMEKLGPTAGVSGIMRNAAAETWRKTRSASNLTDNSSASSDRQVKSPIKKKLRGNFGAKLIRTLSMRRKNRKTDGETTSTSSTSTANNTEEKRKRFAGIKKVVKKLKVNNRNKKGDKKATKVNEIPSEESESAPSTDHFLGGNIREDSIRTISDSFKFDKRDTDSRHPITSTLCSTSDKNIVKNIDEIQDMSSAIAHPNCDSDNDKPTSCAPIITITLADKEIDTEVKKSKFANVAPSVPLLTTTKAFNETLNVCVNSGSDSSQCHFSASDVSPTSGHLTSPPILPSLSPLLGKSKNKLCKRTKGLNDCIAMLTSKLQCKDITSSTAQSLISNAKESTSLPLQQQPETPVVVVTPHDTSTEEQNVVIPEETVSENLESAKEPETAPPSPIPLKNNSPEIAPSSQTSITINDMTSPVIEQDKENIQMERKSLLPGIKQGYDVNLEKVVDLIKCFEDIHPKEIRNGHLDYAKTDVINGLKGLTKKPAKQTTRKIGTNRKASNKRSERTFVQEQLNIAKLEEKLIMNDFERKIGSRRSLPQRKTKKTFVDLKIPEIKLKNRNLPKCVPKKDLSTILEEPSLYDDFSYLSEKSVPDTSQVLPHTPQTQHVHLLPTIVIGISEEKDDLPVDLSLTRKPEVSESSHEDDVPVDLSTRKIPLKTTLPNMDNVEIVTISDNAALEPFVEVMETSITSAIDLNHKENIQNIVENEEFIMENKHIPRSLAHKIETQSESEDELPLAALRKSIAPSIDSKNLQEESIDTRKIIDPENDKSQTQESFQKKVKTPRQSQDRKLGVINHKEYIPETFNDSFIQSNAKEMRPPELPPISSVESVVCTPDLEIRDEESPSVQNQISGPDVIDFEDIIPVVSISPKSSFKSEIIEDAVKPKAKRGRKPKAKLVLSNIISHPKKIAAEPTSETSSYEAQQLDAGKPTSETQAQSAKEINNVMFASEIFKVNNVLGNAIEEGDQATDPHISINNKASEIPTQLISKKGAKPITMKTRKVGRPAKAKRGRKPKKAAIVFEVAAAVIEENTVDTTAISTDQQQHQSADCTIDGKPITKVLEDELPEKALSCADDYKEIGSNFNATEALQEASGVIFEDLTATPQSPIKTTTPKKRKGKESEVRHNSNGNGETTPASPDFVSPPSQNNLNNEAVVLFNDKADGALQVSPIKVKSKRGRKPKPKVVAVSEVSPEPSTENVLKRFEEAVGESLLIAPIPDSPKTRSRKRKSDEMKHMLDVATPIVDASLEHQDLNEGDPKTSITIYDFDEEDDAGTLDNSKENVDHLKLKSAKRSKRNGHSPSKNLVEDMSTPQSVEDLKEAVNEVSTPLKDVQNESFIQTPDLNDSILAGRIANRFKVKKGKNSRAKKIPIETVREHYCDICNKRFGRLDSLNKHKRTLTHIAKLSEIEALEAEAKKKQSELKVPESQEGNMQVVGEALETNSNASEKENMEEVDENVADEIEKNVDNSIPTKDIIDRFDESRILSPTSEFMRRRSHSDVSKSMLVTSPFSLKTNNDSLRLADIISDVLNKPVENMESYTDVDKQSHLEPKRYKSLGERKSFDSDSVAYTPTFNISPASTLINKTSSDEFLKNQLSLLENIIEENKASFEYMDETSVQSVQSIASEKSDRCPSDMSLVSDIKGDDSTRIIPFNDERNFVKPNAHYEEISEDSINNRSYEQDRSRKTLNRDEELFLECCSLLKSGSEVSESKKSHAMIPSEYNIINRTNASNNKGKRDQDSSKLALDDDFLSESCPNTPIGDTYDDFSNSDSIKTDWSSKMNEKEYEDISQSPVPPVHGEENSFKEFNFKLDSKSDIDESSNSVDFRKNINAKFVGLMAEAMKGKSPKRKKHKERERRKSDIQTSIMDYAIHLTPKSSSNSTDNFTDVTNDSKKVMTKGAMKVFEGLKVSIPTDEIDMNQVLGCSPTSKRLEIEESAKIIGKSSMIFGNKLGLKVKKKRNGRNRKPDDFLADSGDKLHDVYDFEETQDNTDLFSSKLTFRSGNILGSKDDHQETHEIISNKRAKVTHDIIESESESNNQDLDLFTAEVQSVNSFSTETESSTSVKPPSMPTTQENITKKKCQIMGRIFKNAFKAKVDGSKESTPVDDGDALENYIIGGPLGDIPTPPPAMSPMSKERPKMSEKEMDLLFDKLLQGKDEQLPLKVNTSKTSSACTPLTLPIEKVDSSKEIKISAAPCDYDSKEARECKSKKVTPKSVKNNRRRSRKHSQSSDDEFNLSKTPKKRQIRKSKPRDNGINLDEEIKQCMGVAGRKSQRKCTSGKQNVLIEYWSSDDSEFEAMLKLSMQEMGTADKAKETRKPGTALEPEEGVSNQRTNIDAIEVQSNKIDSCREPRKSPNPPDSVENLVREHEMAGQPSINLNSTFKSKPKRSSGNAKSRNDVRENKPSKVPKTKHPRVPRSAQDEETLAANRRKRAAVDTLYYWSSSSEDDTENLIEVKSVRDEIDDEEDRPQHGWIVGDSPKKLVTLLAHAKGKKTNR